MNDNRRPPSVSVLMGVFYQRKDLTMLRRSVDSILRQNWEDFELLICDSGSLQEASRLLEEYARKDNRVRLLHSSGRYDLAAKLNVCLREARGRYIARMDDDDCSDTDRLSRQLQALEDHSEIAFVGCNVRLFQGDNCVGVRMMPAQPEIKDFYLVQPFIHPTLVFRREALEAVKGYSEDPRQLLCEDYDLLLRLYAAGYRGMNLREPLLDYTIPLTAKGNRKMKHRWNEAVTRYQRFRQLGVLPGAAPYILKPLVVQLIPERLFGWLKSKNGANG